MDLIDSQKMGAQKKTGTEPSTADRWFVASAGIILFVTGTAKLLSALGKVPVLNVGDPLFFVSFRSLMTTVGICELSVAGVCFFGKKMQLKLGLVAWLAGSFAAYRLGLWLMGWHRPCSCLGTMTEAIEISPDAADLMMKIVLAYLLAGTCVLLLMRKNES